MTPQTTWAPGHPYAQQTRTVPSRREGLEAWVKARPGSRTTDVAKAFDISTSLAGKLLGTLMRRGLVHRRKTKTPHKVLNFKTFVLRWYPGPQPLKGNNHAHH